MKINDNFSGNMESNLAPVFKQVNVPIFQNKVYPTQQLAIASEKGQVELVQSLISGFVFNKTFNPEVMNYDAFYQNEQGNSVFFQNHLSNVFHLLKSLGIQNKKVVEVGCGKGVFFEMMLKDGIDCWGFDPTYEGNNERIKREYFDETHKDVGADVIIMRHTLEHIPQPFSFVHTIAKANNYKGFLFVEVPTFEWIFKKNAFWDVFYEHCNYFTEETLGSMFNAPKTGNFFGGQYIYLWADLSKIRSTIPDNLKITRYNTLAFESELEKHKEMLRNNGSFVVWGAGAKGSTFLNLLDSQKQSVDFVIDVNPMKQNMFIAGTGHKIFAPDILKNSKVENIIIMNENYKEEIMNQIQRYHISPEIFIL